MSQSFAVGQGNQAITFTSPAPGAAIVGGPTYTPTATGGASGNPVVFTIAGASSGVCTISSGVVSFIGGGTCTINANQAGNANYLAAPQVQQSFTVAAATVPGAPTIGTATAVEIAAYYVPWLDHVLDVVAAPAATAAGAVVAASLFTDLPPFLRWTLAVVAGGGAAGAVHGATSLTRLKSTAFTAGLGNPVVATAELAGAAATSALALAAPAAALALLALVSAFRL